MKYKPDWPEAAERWSLLWEGKHKGRPAMVVTAPRAEGATRLPVPACSEPERYWLDSAYVIPRALNSLSGTAWLGEAVPSFLFMGGWVTMAHQCAPIFPDDLGTIWFEPMAFDLDRPPEFVLDSDNPWLCKYERLLDAILNIAGRDDFMVGGHCALPGNDMLPLMMGTENFLVALAESPEWIEAAIGQLASNWAAIKKRIRERVSASHDFPYGVAGWAPFWGPQPFAFWQSDVSCMVSPAMYEQFILPDLDVAGNAFGKVWYHLDGAGAVKHLPAILSRDFVRVVQYVTGAGSEPNGPAYLDLYRAIQAAGRIVHVGLPAENVEPLVRELDPGLLCLHVYCKDEQEARELLDAAPRWTAARAATAHSSRPNANKD